MRNFLRLSDRKSRAISLVVAFTLLATVMGLGVGFNPIGNTKDVFTIGNPAYAAGTPDFECDGVNDDVQFQAALDALPAAGGKLVVLAGTYSFGATVSRAIDDVTIQGMSQGSYLTYDGVNDLFDAGGQAGWVFRDFRTDAGGIDVSSATNYVVENVMINATYIGYSTDADADEWAIPSGRGFTLTVAANDSSDASKAQADYVADGVNDQVEIQAAIDAVFANDGGRVLLLDSEVGFATTDITIEPGVTLQGSGGGYLLYGTRITPTGTILIKNQGQLLDVFIGVAPAYAGDVVEIQGLPPSGLAPRIIDNVTFYCATKTGTALLLNTTTSAIANASITHTYFGAISIIGFEKGVELLGDKTLGNISTINGNTFEYIETWGTDYSIYFDAVNDTEDLGLNTFIQVIMQDSGGISAGVTVEGSGNRFLNIVANDFTVPSLVLNAYANQTLAVGTLPNYIDNGTNSFITLIGQYQQTQFPAPMGMPELYGASLIYNYQEMGGTKTNDLSRNGIPATLIHAPTWGTQGSFYKLTYDGANDYTVADNTIALTGDRTYIIVVSPDFAEAENATRCLFSAYIDANNYIYVNKSANADGNRIFALQRGASTSKTAAINVPFVQNEILVVVLTYDVTTEDLRLYVRGVEVTNQTGAKALVGAITMRLGANWTPTNFWKGWEGLFAILPRTMAASEVLSVSTKLAYLYGDDLILEATGTGTITAAATTDVITHGLSRLPDVGKIRVVFTENPTNDVGTVFIDTVTTTQFTVNVENVPGVSELDFSWSYKE